MYTLDQVLPYMYSNIEESPTLKNGLFSDEDAEAEFDDQMNDLMHEPSNGEYHLTIPNFSSTNDNINGGEARSFEYKVFKLKVTKSLKEYDDYCEGKAWSHYNTHFIDLETNQEYLLTSCYYETNYDLIGLYIKKVKAEPAKEKKPKTMFVIVERTPEDYNISGMFDSLKKAVEAEAGNKSKQTQIEEIPINCKLTFNNKQSGNMITGALNVFNLEGNPI